MSLPATGSPKLHLCRVMTSQRGNRPHHPLSRPAVRTLPNWIIIKLGKHTAPRLLLACSPYIPLADANRYRIPLLWMNKYTVTIPIVIMCPVICATTKLYCGSFCLPLNTVHLMPLSVTLLCTVRVLPLLACYHCLTAVTPYPHPEWAKLL